MVYWRLEVNAEVFSHAGPKTKARICTRFAVHMDEYVYIMRCILRVVLAPVHLVRERLRRGLQYDTV